MPTEYISTPSLPSPLLRIIELCLAPGSKPLSDTPAEATAVRAPLGVP